MIMLISTLLTITQAKVHNIETQDAYFKFLFEQDHIVVLFCDSGVSKDTCNFIKKLSDALLEDR